MELTLLEKSNSPLCLNMGKTSEASCCTEWQTCPCIYISYGFLLSFMMLFSITAFAFVIRVQNAL